MVSSSVAALVVNVANWVCDVSSNGYHTHSGLEDYEVFMVLELYLGKRCKCVAYRLIAVVDLCCELATLVVYCFLILRDGSGRF